MNIGNRKGKASFVLFAFTILSFRLLMYFWYIKAPSQHFISDTVRRCILGDGTRLFGLMAVYVIICKLRRTSVKKSQLALLCLFCYSMGKSNALIASWIISSDFLTVFGFLITGYYGAALIDSMHSEPWSTKRRASFAIFSGTMFVAICAFQWRCSVVVFIVCCFAKKIFFPSHRIQMKWGYKLAKTILCVFLLTFLISILVHVFLMISGLFPTSLLINATLLDTFIEGTIMIMWNIKYAGGQRGQRDGSFV